jgi:hypothetical protein
MNMCVAVLTWTVWCREAERRVLLGDLSAALTWLCQSDGGIYIENAVLEVDKEAQEEWAKLWELGCFPHLTSFELSSMVGSVEPRAGEARPGGKARPTTSQSRGAPHNRFFAKCLSV